jgi:hypothetical protein
VKRSVCLAPLCLAVLGSGAFAADWSIRGSVNETVDASNNYFLSNTPSGSTVRSLSALNLDFLARMPTTSYALKTNYSYYKYFGPGAADTSLTSGTPAGATFSLNHKEKLTTYNFSASWQRADVATTLLEQTGRVTAGGSSNTYNLTGGVARELSRTDSVTWSANASTASFTAPNQTPYVDLSSSGSWNHRFSETTAQTTTVNFDWYSEDNPEKTQRLFWKIMTGMQSRLSGRLTFHADIGVDFVNAYQQGVAQSFIPPNTTQQQPGASNGLLVDVGVTYQLLKTTQVSLTAAHSVTPTILGDLQESSSIGLSLNHNINYFSNLSLSTQFAIYNSAGTKSDNFTAQVGYGYRLTRKLRSNLSYTYRQRNDDTGVAKSSTILFSLTRDLTILP